MSARSIRRSLTATLAVAMSIGFTGCDLLEYFTCIQFGECALSTTITPAPDSTKPDTPTNISAIPGDGQVTLTWTPSTAEDVARYEVAYKLQGESQYTHAAEAGKTATSATHTGLTNGVTLYYVVYSHDTSGNRSDPSPELAATPVGGAGGGGRTSLFVFGAPGTGDGQFNRPSGIATSRAGDVYVVDKENYRVQRFGPAGEFRGKWGSQGADNGQFRFPHGVAVDAAGNVYVTDLTGNTVQKFTASGQFLEIWRNVGPPNYDSLDAVGVAVGPQGDVYVTTENDWVYRFSTSGEILGRFGGPGTEPGKLDRPAAVTTDAEGAVYVLEGDARRVSKFTRDGEFITTWGSEGSADSQFEDPRSIAFAPAGGVFVADSGNDRIQEFSRQGSFLSKFGSRGTSPSQFAFPVAVATDCRSRLYVADEGNNRVVVFGDAATGPPPCTSSKLVLAAAASKFRATMSTSTVKRGVRGASAAGVTERGIVARGRFKGKLAGRRKIAVLAPFAGGGTWRTSFDVTLNVATKQGTARGYTLATARRKSRGQVCLKFDTRFEMVGGKLRVTGKFRSLGGTRGGAKLISSGKFTQAYKADKSFAMNGSGRARAGKKSRRMPAACRRLARLR